MVVPYSAYLSGSRVDPQPSQAATFKRFLALKQLKLRVRMLAVHVAQDRRYETFGPSSAELVCW